jgi:hypothetical protein
LYWLPISLLKDESWLKDESSDRGVDGGSNTPEHLFSGRDLSPAFRDPLGLRQVSRFVMVNAGNLRLPRAVFEA